MAKYKLSEVAKEDLVRIYKYGVSQFEEKQADKYFNSFFEKFELIAEGPYTFASVDFIKAGYRKCVCGVDTIFYRVNNDITEIMAIVGKQDRIESFKNL